MNNLIILTIRTFLIGAIVLGVLLFLPAWTLTYWQAWVFIVVFMGSANAIGVYLYLKDPELLERRKKGGPTAEQNMAQRNGTTRYCTQLGSSLAIEWTTTQPGMGRSIASTNQTKNLICINNLKE